MFMVILLRSGHHDPWLIARDQNLVNTRFRWITGFGERRFADGRAVWKE